MYSDNEEKKEVARKIYSTQYGDVSYLDIFEHSRELDGIGICYFKNECLERFKKTFK
jgi:hypothetical protein